MKVFTKTFIYITIAHFLMDFGQYMMNSLIPKYVSSLGAPATIVGFAASVFSLSCIFTRPFSSQLIDQWDKKKILFISTAFIMFIFIGYSFTNNVNAVLIVRFLHGIALGFSTLGFLSIVTVTTEKSVLTQAIAYFSAANALANALSPAISLKLVEWFGYKKTFLCGVIIVVIALILISKIEVPYENKKISIKFDINRIFAKEALLPAGLLVFFATAYMSVNSFLILYAESKGIENIGLFFTVNALTLVISRPILAKVGIKIGQEKVLIASIFSFILSLFLISIAPNLLVLLIASILFALGYGAELPIIQTLCLKSVDKNKSGAASATCYYGSDLGYLIGPLVAGKLVEMSDYSTMYRFMILFLIAALFIIFSQFKKLKKMCKN